jgi:sporulation protein YlmC with PRC-barrel domain
MKDLSSPTSEKHGVVSASTIIGQDVTNRQNENLGEIKELMFDAKSGRMAYAVLTFGGFLGMGNKLFALPWASLQFSDAGDTLILDVDKEKLKAAPGFDQDAEWPDFADRKWGSSIHTYYGQAPYWA